MKHLKRVLCIALAAVVGFACVAMAGAKEDAKARRRERRTQVEQMVEKGEATEGDSGYLVAKAGIGAAKEAVVRDENADRKIGYEAISKETGMALADVQKQAAAAIRRMRSARK
ncbi:MAG: DUF1318 domain-containing protein [Kiritimatiellae bacterium]|nr:DUF1318 domain-containing protein [Kiritimatiellia bacterium]